MIIIITVRIILDQTTNCQTLLPLLSLPLLLPLPCLKLLFLKFFNELIAGFNPSEHISQLGMSSPIMG